MQNQVHFLSSYFTDLFLATCLCKCRNNIFCDMCSDPPILPDPFHILSLMKKNHRRVNIRCHSSDMANCYLKLAEISLSQLKFNNRSALFLLLIVTQPPPLPSWTILHPLVRFQLLTSLITHLQGVNFKMHGERCFFLLADERKNKGK